MMNVGEYGLALNLNANYTLTGATSLTLTFTRPDGTVFSATGGQITTPSTPLVAADGTYAASQYARYLFQPTDLPQAGGYSVRLTYVDASKRLVSDAASFTVNS